MDHVPAPTLLVAAHLCPVSRGTCHCRKGTQVLRERAKPKEEEEDLECTFSPKFVSSRAYIVDSAPSYVPLCCLHFHFALPDNLRLFGDVFPSKSIDNDTLRGNMSCRVV